MRVNIFYFAKNIVIIRVIKNSVSFYEFAEIVRTIRINEVVRLIKFASETRVCV